MRVRAVLIFLFVLLVAACGGSPAPVAASSSDVVAPPLPTSSASAAPVAAPPPPPAAGPLTPGIVIVGEVAGPPNFDPKPALTAMKPELGRCYDETRILVPALHGKLTLQLRLNGLGAVSETTALPGGSANDQGLVGCIAEAMKSATFPKPGGIATITVPLVFRR